MIDAPALAAKCTSGPNKLKIALVYILVWIVSRNLTAWDKNEVDPAQNTSSACSVEGHFVVVLVSTSNQSWVKTFLLCTVW